MICAAAAAHRSILITGGGTRQTDCDAGVEMRLRSTSLSGIVDYTPAEMVMTAKAGTPMADIEAMLAANNQMLPFEPPDHRGLIGSKGCATIGGAFAVNASGPRRYVAGAARDSLLGVRFVNGRGQLVRAGGRVMKNVTGLDLVKLLSGSHGTLGFLTEVTFRVLPAPSTAVTLVISGLSDAAAARAMAAGMAMPVEVSGAAHLPGRVLHLFLMGSLSGGGATVLRVEGRAASVAARVEKLRSALSQFGPALILGTEETGLLWQEIRDVTPYCSDRTRPLWRVSVAPSRGHQLMAALPQADIDSYYDWQGGLIWIRTGDDLVDGALRGQIRALGGGHATLVRRPDRIRSSLSAFEPLQDDVSALSSLIKQKLDPGGIFYSGSRDRF